MHDKMPSLPKQNCMFEEINCIHCNLLKLKSYSFCKKSALKYVSKCIQ